MIITLVSDVLGSENNGTTIAAMNLVNYLKKQGHTVRILCADQDKIGEEGYYVLPNLNFGKLLNNYVKKVGVTLAKPDVNVIKKAINGADHLHIMLPFGVGIKAVKLANENNISVTAGFHMQAQNLTCYIKLNKFELINRLVYKVIYSKFYKNVDAIHYPTQFIKDVFEKNINKKTNGYVISNGVHSYVKKRKTEKPEELKDKIVILTIGRYAREKSQDTLIKAIKHSKYKNKIQLILGGQGVKEKYYKKLAKNLPVEPIFKLYSRDEIINVINYADLYVHSAEAELEGISCLEAICCGKLTVVSNSKLSATKDFAVDEKCLFKNRNPKSLACVIDYWIEHPNERKIYEKKYLSKAQAFNQEECMNQMEKMIIKVHNEKRKA